MDSFELMLAVIFLAILFAVSPQGRDILRGLNTHDRIVKSSTNANNNVRITNEVSNITYKPISVLPINDNEYTVVAETVERPHRQTTFTILMTQLKHDPLNTLVDGVINYRMIRRELIDLNFGINDLEASNPTYKHDELRRMSEDAFKEKTVLEGQVANLKANQKENMDDVVDHAQKLINAAIHKDKR